MCVIHNSSRKVLQMVMALSNEGRNDSIIGCITEGITFGGVNGND